MDEERDRFVVLGGGFAGVEAAFELASQGVKPVLIDAKDHFEYTPCLPDLFRGRFSHGQMTAEYEKLFKGTGVEFRNATVLGVDTERKTVETSKGAYSYEGLIVALGAEMNDLGMDVSDADNCYSLDAAKEIKKKSEEVESVTIVGAGYVGVEVAGELCEKGLDVTVVDTETRPMPHSNNEVSEMVLEYFNNTDISFKAGRRVDHVEGKDLVLANEETVESDMLVWASGIRPNKVVRDSFGAGHEGLEVNKGCSTKFDNVFAIGDCSNSVNTKTAHEAMKEGQIAAENVLKGDNEVLSTYESNAPHLLSLGNSGLIIAGDKAFKNQFFRYLKDFVRHWYFLHLKRKSIFSRLFNR